MLLGICFVLVSVYLCLDILVHSPAKLQIFYHCLSQRLFSLRVSCPLCMQSTVLFHNALNNTPTSWSSILIPLPSTPVSLTKFKSGLFIHQSPLHPLLQRLPTLLTIITRIIALRLPSPGRPGKILRNQLMPAAARGFTILNRLLQTLHPRLRLRSTPTVLLLVELAIDIQADTVEDPIPLLARIKNDAAGCLPVAAGAAGFLNKGLEATGEAVMEDEADGRGVDAHAEGRGGDDNVEAAPEGLGGLEGRDWWVNEIFLQSLAECWVEAGVIGGCGYIVRDEAGGKGFGGGAEGAVNYAAYGKEIGLCDGGRGCFVDVG